RERRGKGHSLVTEYRYDCQHRLIGVTKPNGQTARYRYDPFGRRISKTIEEKTTEFFWQGDKLIAEHHADRHRSYLYEPDSFRPLALLEGFGPEETKPYYYQLDHLGTPQELTTPDGEIVWSAHHRAYGEISRLDVGKVDNPLRFQGQYFDQESGLHYNRHRYYHPNIGRYLTPDPVKLAGGINAYQYVPNPTGWVDPLGLSNCPEGKGCNAKKEPKEPAIDVQVDAGEPNSPSATQRPSAFASKQKLNEHYEKHGSEFGADSSHEYLLTARHVINEGTQVQYSYRNAPTTGYVLLMGTNRTGKAKFAFAGTNTSGHITTLHTKSGKDFWRMINGDPSDKTIRPHKK
ncbi:RHS repeat domain-containing protein, partial [Pseudomonas sp. 28 E 9]|uniref:RHS repeat domain-containing protein n=1 Tax=Pseudomonas sp. 28 E 9 TaxID=1844098 RepID=UPI000AF727C9